MSQIPPAVVEVVKSLATSRAEALSVKSQAMRPLSAPLAVGALLACVGVVAANPAAMYFGFILITAFSALLGWAYVHLLHKAPDRLGTEAYVIRRELLRIAAKDPEMTSSLREDANLEGEPEPSLRDKKKRALIAAEEPRIGGE